MLRRRRRRERGERRRKSAEARREASTKTEIGGNHDVVRFGVNDSVKGDLAPPHPLQASVHKDAKFWADKKRFGAEAIYGSAFNIRKDLDAQILSKFQRPPGALPSSMLGYEALTGSLDDFGFEDYLNLPQDSESFRAPDMHHGMEVRLGLSKGPVCPSFN